LSRFVSTTSRQASREIRDLVQSALAAELICPSARLWLVSAWITDASVLDNGGGEFGQIVPSWPEREIRLSEALGELLVRGSRVHIVTNTHSANGPFAHAMASIAASLADEQFRLSRDDALTTEEEEGLHRKRLVTEQFVIWGSMNFTRSGLQRNAEDVSFELDAPEVARAINEMEQLYGAAFV
jgi:phosphatidylserine/phosphatidylglycerophosphate/cardiolipin synthase-like enzyme